MSNRNREMGSTALFKTATIFSGALLVGHIRHGLAGGLYKAWGTSLTAAASTSAATGWDYMNVGFLLHGAFIHTPPAVKFDGRTLPGN